MKKVVKKTATLLANKITTLRYQKDDIHAIHSD